MDAVPDLNLDYLWGDNCGVSSKGLTTRGEELSAWAKRHPNQRVFASVAFKYQPAEPDPAEAARQALAAGFIPTTSGSATGSPPTLEKIRSMSEAAGGKLAIGSGMTVENVREYIPYVSHILVSTGISQDEHRWDQARMRAFVNEVRRV
jgi:predicted TIM-barrel enzyme